MNTAWEERDTLIIAVQGPSGSDLRWHHDFLKWKPRRVTSKPQNPISPVLVQIPKKCIQNAVKNGTHMSILFCTSIVPQVWCLDTCQEIR